MTTYEYKVLPAPSKGRKGPGVKGGEARFAHALEALMNEMAADGWHYLRSDMLPHEERQGIRSSHTTYRSVLVFHRHLTVDAADEPMEEDSTAPADTQIEEPAPDETQAGENDVFEKLRQYEEDYKERNAPESDPTSDRPA